MRSRDPAAETTGARDQQRMCSKAKIQSSLLVRLLRARLLRQSAAVMIRSLKLIGRRDRSRETRHERARPRRRVVSGELSSAFFPAVRAKFAMDGYGGETEECTRL
jgi:hypothetical protein